MSNPFELSFEQAELVNGLGEDKPVWLYMRASVFNDKDPATPIWSGEVGSLPPDANSQIDGFPSGDAGKYAENLVRDVAVRADDAGGKPRFHLPVFSLGTDQHVELTLMLLPKVWFEKKKIPASEFDQAVFTVFAMLVLNAAGGGLVGSIVGFILGALNPFDDEQEIEVPCFNSVIMARHVFRENDLVDIFAEGMRRFGPRDNEGGGLCTDIDSYYWLSVAIPQFQLPAPEKPTKTSCTLEPRAYVPKAEQLAGRWGDLGDGLNDRVYVYVSLMDEAHANVSITERASSGHRQFSWERAPITRGTPSPAYFRNFYDDPLVPPMSVKPACPYCSGFVNLFLGLVMPRELFIASMMGGSHVGTRPIVPLRLDTDRATQRPACHCLAQGVRADRTERARRRDLYEPADLGAGVFAALRQDGLVDVWRPGQRRHYLHSHHHQVMVKPSADLDLYLNPELPISWIATARDGSFIATYAEIHKETKCCRRLRYVRMGADGKPVVDVMLEPLASPVN